MGTYFGDSKKGTEDRSVRIMSEEAEVGESGGEEGKQQGGGGGSDRVK